MVLPLIGWAVVAGVAIYYADDHVEGAISEGTETVIRYAIKLIVSLYGYLFGFPLYLIDSILHFTVGYIDPMRSSKKDTVGRLTVGQNQTIFASVSDVEGALTVPMSGGGRRDIIGSLRVQGTALPVDTVGSLVIPYVS